MASTPASTRRIGSADSETRAQLVDAAERLLLRDGYAAVTSRRVASEAGLKPQLVHYYFRKMDELFLEVFRRRADENLARFRRAIEDDCSLATLWRLNADPRGARFRIEFAALANHRKEIRDEIARYAERFRAAQLDALTTALHRAENLSVDLIPPEVLLMLMTGVTQVLALEDTLGITAGHDETMRFIEQAVARLHGDGSGDSHA